MNTEQIKSYIKDYEEKGFNIYPGLGNHDYENYIDGKWCDGYFISGGSYRAKSQNFCAIRLLKWFETRIESIPTVRKDYTYDGRSLSGSMAYSFDIGNWHFIQLNNHPGYHKKISSYDSAKSRFRVFNIKNLSTGYKVILKSPAIKKLFKISILWRPKNQKAYH